MKFSSDDISMMLSADAKALGVTKRETPQFCIYNREQYTTASNVWYALMVDLSGHELREIFNTIRYNGLLVSIKQAVTISDAMIRGTTGDLGVFAEYINYFDSNDYTTMRDVLMGLRFLKRFTIGEAAPLHSAAVQAFLARQNSAKLRDRVERSDYILSQLRYYLDALFKETRDCKISHFEWQGRFSLPTGATENPSVKTLNHKIKVILQNDPLFFGSPIAYSEANTSCSRRESRANFVPKNHKSYRTICQENPYYQCSQTPLSIFLDEKMKRGCKTIGLGPGIIDIHDQTRNQELAKEGSITGELATIDLSAASDSLTCNILRSILPDHVRTVIDNNRSEYTYIEGKKYTNYLYLTMGSRVTFPIETAVFYSIIRVAYDIAGRKYQDSEVGVYGDDMICHISVVDTLIDLLGYLGFSVNVEKSFFSGHYRESCGSEFIHGIRVDTVYWPRKLNPSVIELIALQHRIVGYFNSNSYLVERLWDIVPNITSSYIGSIYDDIWCQYPTVRKATPPCEKGAIIPDGINRELHTTNVVKWSGGSYDQVVEEYLYTKFLKFGPQYSSPLDELLGVSERVDRQILTGCSSNDLKLRRY